MNKHLRNGLIGLGLGTFALGTSACNEVYPKNYEQGLVIGEFGNLPGLRESHISGGLLGGGGESVALDQAVYGITARTSDGREYTIQLDEVSWCSTGPQTIHNVAARVKLDHTTVRFPTSFDFGEQNDQSFLKTKVRIGFNKSRIGLIDIDDLEILN